MSINNFSKSGHRVLILLGQFLVLVFCFIYLDFVYLTNIRPDQLAKETFLQTNCFIMSKKLSTKGKFVRRYRADFLINYHANGVQYNRWVSGNGLDMSYSMNSSAEEQMLTNYDNGGNYTCWYNPGNAEMAVLVMRRNWLPVVSLIIPLLAGIVMVLSITRTGLALLRRKDEKRDQKTRIEPNKFEF